MPLQKHRPTRPIATVEVHAAPRPPRPNKNPRPLWSPPLLLIHPLTSLPLISEPRRRSQTLPRAAEPEETRRSCGRQRSRGSMSTTSSCSSSAPSHSSARPGANPVFHSLSSRARTSPSPSEPEGHRRRARPHTPPRALLRAGS
jgi:hypothetical protein